MKIKLPLPIQNLAQRLGLYMSENGNILYISEQGAGFDIDRWMTMINGRIHIEVALSRINKSGNPIGTVKSIMSDPIDEKSALEILIRWAMLEKTENEIDSLQDDLIGNKVLNDLMKRLKK